MTVIADLLRDARVEAGLSVRALAARADVSFTTICRIERNRIDPTIGTVRKLLGALGEDIEMRRCKVGDVVTVADLADAWSRDGRGGDQPDWTRLRALVDHVARDPGRAERVIQGVPAPSGSRLVDNLLAGIAEKIADDNGLRRPSWTRRIEPLTDAWESFGTPRMRALAAAATPPQLAGRGISIPAETLWRRIGR